MTSIHYDWLTGSARGDFAMAFVPGSFGQPYSFGDESERLAIELRGFYIGILPVTQAFWIHVMGEESNPSVNQGPDLPVENVTWDQITGKGGFLERINGSEIRTSLLKKTGARMGSFRLPSETEWEYAARGGPFWPDGFSFSGSDNIDAVAWYDRKHGDHTQPTGLKAPNQLGIYDMSGNVWEWCHDVFTEHVERIPKNGAAHVGQGEERVLRGGCFHNWAIHCTVSKRYAITQEHHDGCIGFRLVLALENSPGAE